ncbi:MAG: mechanosensitive ion channel [Leptospiraceae bacterium]|nr:mechanosensitive ion channel [Leptospiraceae bacterium]
MKLIAFLLFLFCFEKNYADENPLTPLRLNSPAETMQVFLDSMNEYKKGIEKNDPIKIQKIEKAINCLDLKDINPILRDEKGKEKAIFLKEILDRVYIPNYKTIPSGDSIIILKWIVPDTEITIQRVDSGDRQDEFLFSSNTVERLNIFYNKVESLPYLKGTGGGANYSLPWKEKIFPAWSMELYLKLHLWQWIGILGSFVLGHLMKYFSKVAFYLLLKLAKRTETQWDEKLILAVNKPFGYFSGIFVLFAFLYLSDISGKYYTVISFIYKLFFCSAFIYLVYNLSYFFSDLFKSYMSRKNNPMSEQLVPLVSKSLKIFLFIFAILISLQSLGVNVISLIAGLGIGGLALALAARDTMANLFGSIMIFLDKPFKVGDHILIPTVEGIVEEVGFRSTLVRTFNDSLVSIPNSIMANSNIDNMGERRVRRTNVTFGLKYSTTPEQLEGFLEGVKNILNKHPEIQKEGFQVCLKGFSAYCLEIQMHYYAKFNSSDEDSELKQNVHVEILFLAQELKVEFAYPTQLIELEKSNEKPIKETPSIGEIIESAKNFQKEGKSSRPDGLGIFTPKHKEITESYTAGSGV